MGLHPLVIQQLKHDAPYAWHLRNQASVSPMFRSQHLVELDRRLESYLACFQVSPPEREHLLSKLNPIDWGVVFITAHVALCNDDAAAFERAVAILTDEQQARELSDALCSMAYATAQPHLSRLLTHDNPLARIAAITATGFFRAELDPATVGKLLTDTPAVVAATLKVIGSNKRNEYRDAVVNRLRHDNPRVSFAAAYAGSLLGLPAALPVLKEFCAQDTPFLRTALALIYHVLPADDIRATVAEIHESALSPRLKAHSIAMAGLPDGISILLEWLDDPEYGPVAGEAFSFITGVDLEDEGLSLLDVELCESQEAPLAVKRKKDRWTQAYEADLPWPDPESVKHWWSAHHARFQPGTRYLAGDTLTDAHLQRVLAQGTQTQRHAASLILGIRHPTLPVTDVTAGPVIGC